MTLNIMSIVVEEPDDPQSLRGISGTIDQFWTAAGDVLIEIVSRRPDIQKMIDPVVDAGGDIEITAHNRAGRISLTLAGPSGLRHIVFADAQQWMARPSCQPREKRPPTAREKTFVGWRQREGLERDRERTQHQLQHATRSGKQAQWD